MIWRQRAVLRVILLGRKENFFELLLSLKPAVAWLLHLDQLRLELKIIIRNALRSLLLIRNDLGVVVLEREPGTMLLFGLLVLFVDLGDQTISHLILPLQALLKELLLQWLHNIQSFLVLESNVLKATWRLLSRLLGALGHLDAPVCLIVTLVRLHMLLNVVHAYVVLSL